MQKIFIDFQGGAHGNFLEFVCNKFLGKIPTAGNDPFNGLHASHDKKYLSEQLFVCGHFSAFDTILSRSKVISIRIDHDDLLPLQCISLLRAGDYDIDPRYLEKNTYHKLINHPWMLKNLISSFFNTEQLISAYSDVADASWPKIESLEQYLALPENIRHECQSVHGIKVDLFDQDHPDCPREVLKEFFQIGFANPAMNGFMVTQQKNIHIDCDICWFPFSSFYDTAEFVKSLENIARFVCRPFDQTDQELLLLHKKFLGFQPFKTIKSDCDRLVERLLKKEISSIPELDVIQEAYISAMIENNDITVKKS